MPVRALRRPTESTYAGFVERLFFAWLDSDLRTGRMTAKANGKIVSEAVAYARLHGFLPRPL